jgi:Tol biopolymer transport system component
MGELWSQSSDGDEPVKIASNVDVGIGGGGSWSPDGGEVAFVRMTSNGRDIWKVNAAGDEVALTKGGMVASGAASVRWSPTGESVAFVSKTGAGSKRVWMVPAQGGEPRPLATPGEVTFASWSPNGQRLAIVAGSADSTDIWSVPVDGVEGGLLVSGPWINTQPDWSPDGSQIAFASNRPMPAETVESEPSWNIWRVSASGGEVSWLMEGHSPDWSSDGSEILHVWDGDVWAAPAAGGVPITLAAVNNDESRPRWSRDGSKIRWRRPTTSRPIGYLDHRRRAGRCRG